MIFPEDKQLISLNFMIDALKMELLVRTAFSFSLSARCLEHGTEALVLGFQAADLGLLLLQLEAGRLEFLLQVRRPLLLVTERLRNRVDFTGAAAFCSAVCIQLARAVPRLRSFKPSTYMLLELAFCRVVCGAFGLL